MLFEGGLDLEGLGIGPAALGVLPSLGTQRFVTIDTTASRFTPGARTNVRILPRRAESIPPGVRRPGYPENVTITFANTALDTSFAGIGAPARPAKFRITTDETNRKLRFRFRDVNGDSTLSAAGEFIEAYTPVSLGSTTLQPVWRFEFDPRTPAAVVKPGAGDVYHLVVRRPYAPGDVLEFTTVGPRVDADSARSAFADQKPYVVPNPYVSAAQFEPERFAVSGRGERRLEFRAVPQGATIRIYTLAGDLVQTLQQDGSLAGMIPWDLRSKDNLEVAPGLYFYHVDAGEAGTYVGRFAIIK